MENERRNKIVYVPRESVLRCLRQYVPKYVVISVVPDLPEGFMVKDVHYICERDAFGFIISHPSFDVVPIGTPCPEIIMDIKKFQRIRGYCELSG